MLDPEFIVAVCFAISWPDDLSRRAQKDQFCAGRPASRIEAELAEATRLRTEAEACSHLSKSGR